MKVTVKYCDTAGPLRAVSNVMFLPKAVFCLVISLPSRKKNQKKRMQKVKPCQQIPKL
jgi:hypothetical protein